MPKPPKLSRKSALATLVSKHRASYKAGTATDPTCAPQNYSPAYLAEWRRQCVDERAGLFTRGPLPPDKNPGEDYEDDNH